MHTYTYTYTCTHIYRAILITELKHNNRLKEELNLQNSLLHQKNPSSVEVSHMPTSSHPHTLTPVYTLT